MAIPTWTTVVIVELAHAPKTRTWWAASSFLPRVFTALSLQRFAETTNRATTAQTNVKILAREIPYLRTWWAASSSARASAATSRRPLAGPPLAEVPILQHIAHVCFNIEMRHIALHIV